MRYLINKHVLLFHFLELDYVLRPINTVDSDTRCLWHYTEKERGFTYETDETITM